MAKATVIIRRCPEYDTPKIHQMAVDALDTLDLKPYGRTLVKPNCVMSGDEFPHAYTRPEFLEGILRALKDRARPDTEEIAVGERCGITIPTRFAFKGAGYYPMFDRVGGIGHYHFDEVQQVEVPLYHQERLRDSLFTPEPVARADFFVNCPKFKAHPWTTVTFSMKNYIGIQDDRHRLVDHDHRLNEKVRDLQYIIQPQFIAIDAITAGEGRMLTPIPFDMGLVLFGNNQVAFDVVCCHIIGIDPMSVDHIRMAYESGFGPKDLSEIDIQGDITLEEAQAAAKGFRTGLIRVEDYFDGTSIQAYSGPPPGGEGDDYCWGGCPGAMEEAIEILRAYDGDADGKIPKMHIVFGAYAGDIDAKPGEKVVFIGDCATFKGTINGKDVDLPSLYKERGRDAHYTAKHDDALLKMAETKMQLFKERKSDVIRLKGCPASVSQQVLLLVELSKVKNPYLQPSHVTRFMNTYFSWQVRKAFSSATKGGYQLEGPSPRGDARPDLNLPPPNAPQPLEMTPKGS